MSETTTTTTKKKRIEHKTKSFLIHSTMTPTPTCSSSRNAAQQCLDELVAEAMVQNTMAAWRLQYPGIRDLLEDFAAKQDFMEFSETTAKEVQTSLFSPLNQFLWEQESVLGGQEDPSSSFNADNPPIIGTSTIIVFGGKYASPACSIPERMVQLMAEQNDKSSDIIITVSRTNISIDPKMQNVPSNITHITKQNLDQPGGHVEFEDVIQKLDLTTAANANANQSQSSSIITMYFTLAQHVGVLPFQRNLQGATNFATALANTMSEERLFQVVLTGTDATLPSTHPDSSTMVVVDTANGTTTTTSSYMVPTYKLGVYNFIYAVSKLCQFYIVADAIGTILGKDTTEWKQRIKTMTDCVEAAGDDDGKYYEGTTTMLTIEELDEISIEWNDIEKSLAPYLKVARGISICYTPLHLKPWTTAAFVKCDEESKGSPRGFLLQQVVRRLKNAMSMEKAARLHFF